VTSRPSVMTKLAQSAAFSYNPPRRFNSSSTRNGTTLVRRTAPSSPLVKPVATLAVSPLSIGVSVLKERQSDGGARAPWRSQVRRPANPMPENRTRSSEISATVLSPTSPDVRGGTERCRRRATSHRDIDVAILNEIDSAHAEDYTGTLDAVQSRLTKLMAASISSLGSI
jgi:hypothetical protein